VIQEKTQAVLDEQLFHGARLSSRNPAAKESRYRLRCYPLPPHASNLSKLPCSAAQAIASTGLQRKVTAQL
jgi:hypothetical protein